MAGDAVSDIDFLVPGFLRRRAHGEGKARTTRHTIRGTFSFGRLQHEPLSRNTTIIAKKAGSSKFLYSTVK